MLVSPKQLFKKASKGKYALGAFNASTISITRAVFAAAEKLKSPFIIQTSQGELEYGKVTAILAFLKELAKESSVPVIIYQDHCRDFEMSMKCIKSGYQAILFDGSDLPYEENVALTKKVVTIAHRYQVWTEGEFSAVGKGSTIHREKIPKLELTDPDQAVDFVKRTGVDSLAVSVGNVHGIYEEKPKINFQRLKTLRRRLDVLLVLHGSSGIKEEDIKKAIALDILKINVNTDLRVAFRDALKKILEDPDAIVPYKYMVPVERAVQKVVEEKMKLFGSAGKA